MFDIKKGRVILLDFDCDNCPQKGTCWDTPTCPNGRSPFDALVDAYIDEAGLAGAKEGQQC